MIKKTLFDENLTYDEAVQLIKDGVDVNERNDYDNAPLHVVQEFKIAELLINNGANVNQLDDCDNTPLHLVNDINIAKLLIAHGADVNAKSVGGCTPLHFIRDVEIVQLLIEHHADVNVMNNEGNTPLFFVDNIQVAELLIKHGADVNATNKTDFIPLHSAYNVEIAQLFIKHGALINQRNIFGQTPLGTCSELEIMKLLIDHGADIHCYEDQTIPWCVVHDYHMMKLFINHGANINALYTSEANILTAMQNIPFDVIELLIKSGLNINHRDKYGYTALGRFALRGSQTEGLVELMIDNGAVPCSRDCYLAFRDFFTKEQQHAFDSFSLLFNDDNEMFFNMCMAYQKENKKEITLTDVEMI